jgi:hypothetical protein
MAGVATTTPEAPASQRPATRRFSLRWSHIRALLWLRWKLTLLGDLHAGGGRRPGHRDQRRLCAA